MRILAIDTSVGFGSAAAVDDEGAAEQPLGPAGSHARVLTAVLANLVEQRGWSAGPSPLRCLGAGDVIAVTRGPGSFTGLRVGVTAAKALAWTSGASLVGVSGFEAIARRTARLADWHDHELEIAYDAGRGEVFVATAQPSGIGWQVGEPRLMPVASWLESLQPGRRITGPALDAIADLVTHRGGLHLAPTEAWYPAAADAAAIAGRRAASGCMDDPQTLVPDYLRPSYAEERTAPGGRTPAADR